jgi:hypothetical protein
LAPVFLYLPYYYCNQSKLFNKTLVLQKYGPESALQTVTIGIPPAKPEITLQLDANNRFSGNDGFKLMNN